VVAGLFQSEGPAHGPAQRGEGQEGGAQGLGDAADGHVGPPIVGHHVGVEVVVSELEGGGGVAHEHAAAHLAVHPLGFTCGGGTSLAMRLTHP